MCRFSNGDNELLRLAIESSRQPDDVIRQWCAKFGPDYARRLKRRHGRLGDTWFLDEVLVTINGQRQYLWRAVDQDGDLIDRCFRHQVLVKRAQALIIQILPADFDAGTSLTLNI